jgi:hypothetical protein
VLFVDAFLAVTGAFLIFFFFVVFFAWAFPGGLALVAVRTYSLFFTSTQKTFLSSSNDSKRQSA